MRRLLVMLTAVLLPVTAVAQDEFTYNPPGQLVPGSGTGRADDTVYVLVSGCLSVSRSVTR